MLADFTATLLLELLTFFCPFPQRRLCVFPYSSLTTWHQSTACHNNLSFFFFFFSLSLSIIPNIGVQSVRTTASVLLKAAINALSLMLVFACIPTQVNTMGQSCVAGDRAKTTSTTRTDEDESVVHCSAICNLDGSSRQIATLTIHSDEDLLLNMLVTDGHWTLKRTTTRTTTMAEQWAILANRSILEECKKNGN